MSTRPNEPFLSLLAETRRISDIIQKSFSRSKRASGPSKSNGTSPGVSDGNSPTSLPQYDETIDTGPSGKEEGATASSIQTEDEAAQSTPSVDVDSATPISQEDDLVELMRAFEEDIKAFIFQLHQNAMDSHPPERNNKATSSRAVVTAQPWRSMEDNSACEHKSCCVPRCWC